MKIPLGGALAGISIALCVMATSGAKPRYTGVLPAATKVWQTNDKGGSKVITKPRYKVMTKEEAKEQGKLAMAAIAIGKAKAKAAKERSESKAKANAAKKEKAEAMKLQCAKGKEAKKCAHFLDGHKKELSNTTLAGMLSSSDGSDTSMDDASFSSSSD